MLGQFAIAVAPILGVAMSITTSAGPLLLVMMWAAAWPMAQFTSAGTPTSSSNPFLDDHLIYPLVIIVQAQIGAGRVYGLGNWWAKLTGHNTRLRLIRADPAPPGLKAADNADSRRSAQAVLVMASHP